MNRKFTESMAEEAALEWLESIGCSVLAGPDIAPGEPGAERNSFGDVVLVGRLRSALAQLNPKVPPAAIDDAVSKIARTESPSLIENNRRFHRMLTDGVPVEYAEAAPSPRPSPMGGGSPPPQLPSTSGRGAGGEGLRRWTTLQLVDYANPAANNWLAVNQFTVVENKKNRRPDIVIFLNGLPLAVIELKNPAAENATTKHAFQQFQTYKQEIPGLFTFNELLIASDGLDARVGSLTADWERFMPWRTIAGDGLAPAAQPQLEVMLKGIFDRRRFLDLIRGFVTFEDDGAEIAKKIAGYHQFHAVNKAVEATLRAAGLPPSPPAPLPMVEGRQNDGNGKSNAVKGAGNAGQYRGGLPFSGLLERARELRKNQTRAETLLWELLRDRQLAGAKFRRQHQIGEYVVDLFCADAHLVVECDGAYHGTANVVAHDHQRDAYLRAVGNTVLRFSNDQVLADTESVLCDIARHLPFEAAVTECPSTDGRGGGGEGHANQRIGVIWHTQGSGKSLSMVFYAGRIIQHPAMANPTIVVLTDRNDLDGQLFGTFARNQGVLRQSPVQAESRAHLRELLKVAAGGVVFTTIQKFLPEAKGDSYPLLSDRRNIVVIADEAHRSQYDFIDGFARHLHDALPRASFIGFTGTPIETQDRSTPAVFGDYIDVYDIQQAVEDGATVRIYYEGRLAKIELRDEEKPKIDPEFEEVTEGQEIETKTRLKSKWARLEAMVGTEKRIRLVAEDLVRHFEQRLGVLDGKGLIVCMSRRICVDLYNALTKLRPQWHDADDARGALKIVMTGAASDPLDWQQHIRNKAKRDELGKRFKNPKDPLKLVIVRDMWLTGFDAPCLHTLYVDKPMRGHGLMQAIARVNRVFRDKPGGLVVDYLGLADQLKRALSDYTNGGGRGEATIDKAQAVAVMQEKAEIVRGMFHGFNYKPILTAPAAKRMAGIAAAMDFILTPQSAQEKPEERKKRLLQAVTELSAAFALAVPDEAALAIRDEVGFFQTVRSGLAKIGAGSGRDTRTQEEIETAIRQIVSRAVASDEVVDIFAAAGLKKPDISILSDEFLEDVKHLPHRNLAVELLQKLLNDEIRIRSRKNVVQARSFAEMLERAIRQYQNRSIETAQVIQQLIELAREMREARERGEKLGLNDDEIAFYDALEVNDSAVKVLGDDTLRAIAHELVHAVRRNVTVDWNLRESARAHMRVIVKRILRKYGYPPDKQAKATQTVIEQAEILCGEWAA